MTSREVPLTPLEPIEPIVSSEEDRFGSYANYQANHQIEENESLSEQENQKQLTDNLRILERQRAIEQFITSEEKYCNHLKKLINLYLKPLSKHLSPQDQSTLFDDISTIYEKNATFSITLEQKYKAFDPSSTLIGNDVLNFIPDLRILYQNYVNRHEQASKLLTSLETDSKFIKICDGALAQLKSHKNGLATVAKEAELQSLETLKHLLLLPIDRVTKYESSMRDIMSYTDGSHNDYQNLQQCVHDITVISQLIGDKMREFSERQVVRKIANAIKGNTSFNLSTPYRKFIKNGYLIKMGKTKPQRYLFFLFNDLLFYCKKVGQAMVSDKAAAAAAADKEQREDSNSRSADDDLHINIGGMSSVAHDYSDTSDLHDISALFCDSRSRAGGRSRKSRTKLFTEITSDGEDGADELSMTSFGMNVDIHNELDVFGKRNLGQFKVHNAMPIDMVFDVKDLRIFPQRYDNKAFEIRSSVKSFIVVAESEGAKKEWMSLLEHCTNSLLQQHLANKSVTLGSGSSTPGVHGNSVSVSERSKMKRFAATLYLPNNFTEQCMKCGKQFGYSRRKNHCHHCGWLICSKCLTEKLPSFDSIRGAPNYVESKAKSNTTFKVCGDCYSKNKHLFPEFEEAKIFAYKQKSKKKKKKKKHKFIKMFNKSKLSEDVENDFYEKGSLNATKKKADKKAAAAATQNDAVDSDGDSVDGDSDVGAEPSMHSIPEHDDRIETIIYNEYEGSVSSHLAPHWTPHASSAAGHHNRDFSHNLNDTGYADNDDSRSDSDSDDDGMAMKVTPPVSDDPDAPLSPYYDDTPLLTEEKESPFGTISPPAAADAFAMSPPRALAMRLRPTNSLNMADVLDELEREQEERREEEVDDDDEEDSANDGYDAEISASDKDNLVTQMAVQQKNHPNHESSSQLRAIPEYLDTDDNSTSANDVDPDTAYEHLRNLSTHIEDHEYYRDMTPPPPVDTTSIISGRLGSAINALKVVVVQRSNPVAQDVPGHTPPPVSPRYMKMGAAHKRRLSDKLDKFLTDRPAPPELIDKHILYTTPQEDIDSLKEKIQMKRDERERIKKRLKRKLSHDFRPSEQDIEERGIKIVPEMIIRSDEEDGDEEIIVYDNPNSRSSFSLQKKKSFENEQHAYYLRKERQRNSRRIKDALVARPTPTQMIERGLISASKVNEDIPPANRSEQIARLKAEYNLCLMDASVLETHKRRCLILTFYDEYLFADTPDAADIDADYKQLPHSCQIKQEDVSLEKEWMRNLRKRKLKMDTNERKRKELQIKKNRMQKEVAELMLQIQIVQNTKQIDAMMSEVHRLEKERCSFITNTHKQINQLRKMIKDLTKIYPQPTTKHNSFLSVS
eukprot:74672_1